MENNNKKRWQSKQFVISLVSLVIVAYGMHAKLLSGTDVVLIINTILLCWFGREYAKDKYGNTKV